MALIQRRNAIVKKIISVALDGDKDLEDEEMLDRAQICAVAAMSIMTIAPNDQAARREIRAGVDRLTQVDDVGDHFQGSSGGARTTGQAIQAVRCDIRAGSEAQ
jgi:hypothetical protein